MTNDAQPATGAGSAFKPVRPDATGPVSFSSGWSLARLGRRSEAGALVGTVGMFIFFAIFGGKDFLAVGGVASWLNVASELGIVALPVGLLMIAGELDLSVGSVLAGSSVTCAIVSGYYNAPPAVGVLAGLALGALTGFINGLIVSRTRVASFVVTLATNFGLIGLTLGLSRAITGSTSVAIQPDTPDKDIFGYLIGGKFEIAVVWWVVIALVVAWLLQESKYGNWIFAIGGDLESARTTGIPVNKVKISLFVASGLRRRPGRCHPDHALQRCPGDERPVVRLQLDHRGGGRRGAADRRVRLSLRDHAGHADLRDREPGHLLHQLEL